MSVATFPIDFSLYDEDAHYVLYITDDPTEEHRLNVELENTSPQEISFDPLDDENDYHFELRFRNGTLSEKTLAILQNGAQKLLSPDDADKWQIRLNQNNTANQPYISLYFRNRQPVTFPVKVMLQHISADAGSGARGTRAEFMPHKMTLGGNMPLTGSREQHLFIANHSGQKHIPLHVGFVGSNRILNDGTPYPGNKLTLQIQNVAKPSQEHLATPKIMLRANRTDNKGSKFVVSFDIQLDGEEKPWAVCKERELKLVDQIYKAGWGVRIKSFKCQVLAKDGWVRSSDPGFQEIYPDLNKLFDFSDWSKNEAQSQELAFTLKNDIQLNQGDYFEIELSGFQSTLPSGVANMYLNYHNIPGYWDGHFVLTVEKTQLIFMDVKDAQANAANRYVGIGTIPTAKLDVGGAGDADGQISLQLRAGNSSQSFKSNQITMGWAGSAQYRHAMKTRHHGGQKADNAIDFYVWNYGTDKPDDIGTLHTLTLDGGSVGIGTTSPSAKLHILNANQDANGNTLILGPTDASNLRLGYNQEYSWIQSHGSKPLAINPIGNNVGIGTVDQFSGKLTVAADTPIGFNNKDNANRARFRVSGIDNTQAKFHIDVLNTNGSEWREALVLNGSGGIATGSGPNDTYITWKTIVYISKWGSVGNVPSEYSHPPDDQSLCWAISLPSDISTDQILSLSGVVRLESGSLGRIVRRDSIIPYLFIQPELCCHQSHVEIRIPAEFWDRPETFGLRLEPNPGFFPRSLMTDIRIFILYYTKFTTHTG